MIDATFLNGSSYFCFGPKMLWGIAMLYSIPWVSDKLIKTFSAAIFAIP